MNAHGQRKHAVKKNATEQVPTIVKGMPGACTGYFTREKQYEPPQEIAGKSGEENKTPRHVSCL